jgi:hypothetical protein
MIELKHDALVLSFPEVHPHAVLHLEFQRTLRIPDDDSDYPLPPGLGAFPLRHVDDFAERVPAGWRRHGGVLLPMYQSEAMWLHFRSPRGYPFALKVATGKINAVTGEAWKEGLDADPQDYLSIPTQPWLDGYCVERGIIRQFVAMPLGAGYTAEEQITGEAEHGGLQLVAYPMKRSAYERLQRERHARDAELDRMMMRCCELPASFGMGLAPGGRMRQEIYDDPHRMDDWNTAHSSRCFVHIANSLVWRDVTGEDPPTVPPTARAYARAGLPWFAWYADQPARKGGEPLKGMKSVKQMGQEKGDVPLPENASVAPKPVVSLGPAAADQVRERLF